MWHGRSREKSRQRSCEVCLTLLNLSLCLKSSSNTRRALFRAFNHPRPLIWGPWNTDFTVYQAWGWGGWENSRNFWVKMWLRGRHQDTKMLVEKWGERIFSRPTLRYLATPHFRKRRKLHRVYFCKILGLLLHCKWQGEKLANRWLTGTSSVTKQVQDAVWLHFSSCFPLPFCGVFDVASQTNNNKNAFKSSVKSHLLGDYSLDKKWGGN